MDRACPYLALASDGRTAVNGYDPEHTCFAVEPAEALDRGRQQQLCLTDDHPQCERYKAAEARLQRDAARLPRPAPDALVVSTRMVLDPDPSWRRLGGPNLVPAATSRRLVIGGVAAAVGLAAVAGVATGTFGSIFGSGPVAAASPTPSLRPTAEPTLAPTPAPTAEPTLEPTPAPTLEPTVAPTPVPTAEPTQRTYRVQSGDTLGAIATQFGVTVQAIKDANGLTSDIINIGQVLVIP
jgi:LysM domain